MKILELRAENFKKLRVVEIRPDGNLVPITGKNGQGKSSVLDAIWFALKGKRALPLKAVRKGTERMKVSLETEEFTVTRTLTREGSLPTIALEMKTGHKREKTPQDFLDEIIGELTFDPLAFLQMDAKQQVDMLRRTAKIDVDFDKIDAENKADYDARTDVNREVTRLDGQIAGINVLDGLPKAKIDEAAIMAKLNDASAENTRQIEISRAKEDMRRTMENARGFVDANESTQATLNAEIERLKQKLAAAKTENAELARALADAKHAWEKAPSGELVDVAALTQNLASAQRTNRAIDERNKWEALRTERDAHKRHAEKLTRQIEARNEKKAAAIAGAKIPVEGITFDESQVLFNGLPMASLGEGEQIRISTQIGMAANPRLRVLCIRHGEALDEDGLTILGELAKANDFQVWMARVDSSGKVGIVLEDGMVAEVEQ
jgi:DNA repair exonuclease SbcCD ATPase subunit